MSVGCSSAVAGRKEEGDQADPAEPSLQLWEDKTEMWPAVKSWLLMALYRELGKGWEGGSGSGKPWTLPPLFCWVGWPNLAAQWDLAWWHLLWWCMT